MPRTERSNTDLCPTDERRRLLERLGMKLAIIGGMFSLCMPLAGFAAKQADDQLTVARITQLERDHWSFRTVVRPPIPAVTQTEWAQTPIDRFIEAGLAAKGLLPNPSATPAGLLRRLYLNVIGLPPTIEEQERFLSAPTTAAYAHEVDRLLGHPAYGERWGRHWLDLVRYAESNGYERDAEKPHVWRYRDYVIESLNSDKPFNRFALEQLAGDELPNRTAATLIATGFYRLGPWDDEPADVAQDRHDQLDDMIRTTSQVFLGITLGCARCHDHKFDPLGMIDYYRMSAIFAPLHRPTDGRREMDRYAGSADELAAIAERDQRISELQRSQAEIRDGYLLEFLASGRASATPAVVAAFRTEPNVRSTEQAALVSRHQSKLNDEVVTHLPDSRKRRYQELEAQMHRLREECPDPPRGYFFVEHGSDVPKSYLLLRGRAATPGAEVGPGLPEVLVEGQPKWSTGQASSGRRLVLARWITAPTNQLTARVIVNRVWQYHFGQGLVRTPSDFGVMGDTPSHPQLLDWLADWLVHEGESSLKRLHRLILLSNTYKMSKAWNPSAARIDPENRLLWRFPYQRLSVEAIRDAMLAASGSLNQQMFGPAVRLDIPRVVVEAHADRDTVWKPSSEREQARRTVYAYVKRSLVVPMLDVLDLCDTTRSTERRNITSVAPQALTLFNGSFVNRQAELLADRVITDVGIEPRDQIERAWRLALGRLPSPVELAAMLDFLTMETERLIEDADRAMTRELAQRRSLGQVCRVIFNLNEFVYPN